MAPSAFMSLTSSRYVYAGPSFCGPLSLFCLLELAEETTGEPNQEPEHASQSQSPLPHLLGPTTLHIIMELELRISYRNPVIWTKMAALVE